MAFRVIGSRVYGVRAGRTVDFTGGQTAGSLDVLFHRRVSIKRTPLESVGPPVGTTSPKYRI